jgi:translation elongation factor P/translation initiation factor 5A
MNKLYINFKELRTLSNLTKKHLDYSIEDLKEGSFFFYNQELLKVKLITTYKDKQGWEWYELECFSINSGKTIYFEYEIDDYIEVSITIKEINFRDLNISSDKIEEMADLESGSIIYDSIKFNYDDDYSAKWTKKIDNKKIEEKVYFYDFYSTETGLTLTIEEWKEGKGNYEYKAYLSKDINYRDIIIVSI